MISNFRNLPKFNVNPSTIEIISNPIDFYDELKNGIQQAKKKIVFASLYFGSSEDELVNLLNDSLSKNADLRVLILIDYFRGTRMESGESSSASILNPLIRKYGDRFRVCLYQTPNVGTIVRQFVPPRFIEGFGLQHMKAYVFDDDVIISGANLSKDYFTNRQDRYMKIKDSDLSTYCTDLITTVSTFSHSLNTTIYPPKRPVLDLHKAIESLTNLWVEKTERMDRSSTVVIPALQMHVAKIHQDETALSAILSSQTAQTYPISNNSTITIATAYFNLPKTYQSLIWASKARFNLYTSSPKANGFFNSKGVSRFIPPAYTYFQQQFLKQAKRMGKDVAMYEYERKGWTWHGKGVWILKDGGVMTAIGSSNMNYRSFTRDLELQMYIVSTDHTLRSNIIENMKYLNSHASPVTRIELGRRKSSWLLRLAARTINKML